MSSFLYLSIVSCQSNKTISKTEINQVTNEFISGTVKEIQRGKDSYTAKIITANNLVYFTTISHSNLTDASQYKQVNIGDSLTVRRDVWKPENESDITVRELK